MRPQASIHLSAAATSNARKEADNQIGKQAIKKASKRVRGFRRPLRPRPLQLFGNGRCFDTDGVVGVHRRCGMNADCCVASGLGVAARCPCAFAAAFTLSPLALASALVYVACSALQSAQNGQD